MAKKATRRPQPRQQARAQAEPPAQWDKLTAGTKTAITGIRAQFKSYTESFSTMLSKRADLADPLMKLYGTCLSELGRLTFVNFLQLIDPTIPSERDDRDVDGQMVNGYRNHAAYQAGEYLRRLTTRRQGAEGEGRARRPRRMSAVQQMARTIATILPLFQNAQAVWDGIREEFQLDAAGLDRLRKATAQTQPLFALPNVRRMPVRVLHMAPPPQPGQVAEGEAEAPGARRRVAS